MLIKGYAHHNYLPDRTRKAERRRRNRGVGDRQSKRGTESKGRFLNGLKDRTETLCFCFCVCASISKS